MKYIKLFEDFNSDLYYRGIKLDSGRERFRMQTWVKDKHIAERYTNSGGLLGRLLVAHLNYKNPLDFSKEELLEGGGSQIPLTELLKYFTEDEIRKVLKNCMIRDYKDNLDYVEKDGISDSDKLEDVEVVIFDLVDIYGFEDLLKKHGYDCVIYYGWEGLKNGEVSLEYRTFDENIEIVDLIDYEKGKPIE